MPPLSGVSGNALASLTSIDQWIATLNSTVGGTARTGFKASKITFGGGSTDVQKPSANGQLGIQFAEQSLQVGSTNIDFSEGQVVASTEFTHMALSGNQNAFFMLTDDPTLTVGTAKIYYTRDGEFHRDSQGRMVSADGLFLVGSKATSGALQIVSAVTSDPEQNLTDQIDAANAATTAKDRVTHAIITNLQGLKFSKYGSTVYEDSTAANPPATLPTTLVTDSSGTSSNVRVNGSSLEASNVQLPSSLVELSLAQKIYSALTKVIQIDQQKMDSILSLVR